jgi:hypothetical protein
VTFAAIVRTHPDDAGFPVWQVRRSFAIEERQNEQTARTGWHRARDLVELLYVDIKRVTHEIRAERAIHRAYQRQPSARRAAKRRYISLRIGYGSVGISVQGTGTAEAHGQFSGSDVTGAYCSHHVVTATGRHRDA